MMSQFRDLPLVSIVISTFQSRDLIRDCLDSLLNQSYPNIEIIVVDAGSTDGTTELIRKEYKNVHLVRKGNMGIGEANNIGISRAKGDLIAFDFNTDEIARPSWLTELVSVLTKNKTIGMVGGTRILYGTDKIDDAGFVLTASGITKKVDQNRPIASLDSRPRIVDYVGAPLIKREIFDAIGLCEELYYFYSEDVDFGLRAQRAGYKVVHVPKAISEHRVSTTVGLGAKHHYYLRRAQICFCLLNYSGIRLFASLGWWMIIQTLIEITMLLSPMKKLARMMQLEFLAQRGTSEIIGAILAAIGWNIKNLGAILRRRRERLLRLQLAKIKKKPS